MCIRDSVYAGLEAEAGAQADLFKHEDHLLGVEGVAIFARITLDVMGELEKSTHFSAGEIGDGAEIFSCESSGGGEDVRIFLDRNNGLLRFVLPTVMR